MKHTRKIVYIEEIVKMFEKDGREISHSSISSWLMQQVQMGTSYAGKYGSIMQGDIALYFREYYKK